MKAFRIYGILLLAETLNAVSHVALIAATGLDLLLHALSNGFTILLIVIAARASFTAGLGTVAAGVSASFIWLWGMLCGALLNLLDSARSNELRDPIPWEGMALATILLWPVAVAIGVLAAWATKRLTNAGHTTRTG